MTNLKKNTRISKEQLLNLYHNEAMSITEITKYFGLTQTIIIRNLFTEYDIPLKTQAELVKDKQNKKYPLPDKQTFIEEINLFPLSAITKKYEVPRRIITRWMNLYSIQTPFLVNKNLKDKILSKENINLSPKQLSIKYCIEPRVVKYYKKEWADKKYSNEDIAKLIAEYEYDLNNQGFTKQLFYDDPSLYNSIIKNTENHTLTTNKITERLYRILNGYSHDKKETCKWCDAPLKFYTMKKGYGCNDNSNNLKCEKCLMVYGEKSSSISQKIFWNIYNRLEDKKNCYFHELNYEKDIFITKNDEIIMENEKYFNTYKYIADFVYKNKIIEFDGDYWHQNKEKEQTKDKFYKLKGYDVLHILHSDYNNNPEQMEEKCLKFLIH